MQQDLDPGSPAAWLILKDRESGEVVQKIEE